MAKTTRHSQRGAALITVLVALMIMSILLLEFQYNSLIERKLAYNDLNQLQAYYLAKSGARIGLLRVALFARAKSDAGLKSAFAGADISPFLDSIWNLPLPAFPPEREKVAKLAREDKQTAENQLKQTRVSDGSVTHVISSEGSKINLNSLIVPASVANNNGRINFNCTAPKEVYEHYGCLLINLLENFLKDSDDPFQEYGNLRPEEVVMDIMDWVNPGPNRFAGGAKDAFYEQQLPPYKAKRNRFYTVDELKLVKGIDDHLFAKLKPYITVYSEDGRINLNTASSALYRALYRDFTEDDLKRIMEKRTEQGGWVSEKDFVDFVTKTLGRSGFSTIYSDATKYPFTINSRSFIVESLGVLKRSKSQVQKVIRVAVALTRGKQGMSFPNIGNQAECVRDNLRWWDSRFPPGVCRPKPTNAQDCQEQGGTPWEGPPRNCCHPNNVPEVCLPPASGGGGGGATGTPATPQEPNALKILSWSES